MYYKHLKNLKEKTFFASVLRLTNLQNSILKFKQLVAVQNTRMCPVKPLLVCFISCLYGMMYLHIMTFCGIFLNSLSEPHLQVSTECEYSFPVV